MTPMDKWQFWIDRGGTFTDIVARKPDGDLVTHKLLSENPEQYEDAALQGIRDIFGIKPERPIPAERVQTVKMGTTVATNALLERKGDRVAFVTTKGFADILRIGYQNRPRLFDLHIKLPEMLYEQVIEVNERISAHGDIVTPPDLEDAQQSLQAAFDDGIRAVAIVFIHAYRNPAHEQAIGKIAKDIGFTQISLSSETSPLMKVVSRGDTTVVDAYLSPILRRYVDRVAAELGNTNLMFMQSNGGLTDARLFQGKDSILSGPAGGVVGMVRTAGMAGLKQIIGFDMGGTSTDVSHYDGAYERTFETVVAGVRLRAPMMNIHTVAAGGGSILHFDGSRFRVGPDSAGANPGPACYRRGGPLTVTDCNVMLGKISPDYFPSLFGPNGNEPLDKEVVCQKFKALAKDVEQATGKPTTAEEIAEGFLNIAVENMANAIKQISVQRGYDISTYALSSFGGAGGQHACLVADALGMEKVFIHPLAGVLSAYGMGLADIRALREATVEIQLKPDHPDTLQNQRQILSDEAEKEVLSQGIAANAITIHHKAHLKYQGTDTALMVPFGTPAQMKNDFFEAHRQRFGFVMEDKPIIIEALSVEAIGETEAVIDPEISMAYPTREVAAIDQTTITSGTEKLTTPVFKRKTFLPGHKVNGPAIIVEETATTIVEPGWQAEANKRGHLILTRYIPREDRHAIGTTADPVMLEIFNNLFMSIAEQMGATLANTAYSVNIKERLDFSCAVFDGHGELVANAPHMPVHLGSMGESVQTILKANKGSMKPGHVYVLNAPYNGGTHLPDVTVVSPVFDGNGTDILFFVASRGHHADIGGITPGSMPPHSTTVEEEGILIDNFLLVEEGRIRETEFISLLSSGPYPARNPAQNVADIRAQLAANKKGIQELEKMIDHFGLDVVKAYMGHVQDNAEESVRRILSHLQDGEFTYPMDNGAVIKVAITLDKTNRRVKVDFTGTSDQVSTNFNAPFPVCRAAVLYVFRTLVDDDIPLNAGCLKPVDIIAPAGCMLNPRYPAAVVAGNVETSQAIVDCLYGALGRLAASQGTMNNFTFGNDRYQYYETIAGGSGAGPGFDGTDAIQSHMTNSRLTDPEVLEWRFPVRLEEFSIRRQSGGNGQYRGGNGVTRKIRFLEGMTAAILSGHRSIPPYGLKGGKDGKTGENQLEKADGTIKALGATAKVNLSENDAIIIKTPGGGGFGEPE